MVVRMRTPWTVGMAMTSLKGGTGADILRGGADNDTADYSDATTVVTANLTAGSSQATVAGDATGYSGRYREPGRRQR